MSKALTSHGFCFGFTLCDAAMEQAGKLKWWEDAINAVANWDGSEKQLHQKIRLAQAENEETLLNIFNRVLDYIVYHFVTNKKEGGIAVKNLSQLSILDPQNQFFELLVKSDKEKEWRVKKVVERASVAGSFSDEHFKLLLDPTYLAGNMCFLHSPSHLIRVSYDPSQRSWTVYNPNYSLTQKRETFASKEEALTEIKKIFRCIGKTSVAIDLVALGSAEEKQSNRFAPWLATYNSIVDTKPMSLVAKNGLHLMIKYQPEALLKIIRQAGDKKNKNRQKLISQLIELVQRKSKQGNTSLDFMMKKAPNCFIALCELAFKERANGKGALASTIIESIHYKNKNNKSVLDHASRAPLPIQTAINSLQVVLFPVDQSRLASIGDQRKVNDWLKNNIQRLHANFRGHAKYRFFGLISPKSSTSVKNFIMAADKLGKLYKPNSPQLLLALVNQLESEFDTRRKKWLKQGNRGDFIEYLNKNPNEHYSRLLATLLKSVYQAYYDSAQAILSVTEDRLRRYLDLTRLSAFAYQFDQAPKIKAPAASSVTASKNLSFFQPSVSLENSPIDEKHAAKKIKPR